MISLVTRFLRLALALPLLSIAAFLLTPSFPQAQNASPSTTSITPGPKPADAPSDWKRLVGVYKGKLGSIFILEREKRLYWLAQRWEYWMNQDSDGTYWVSLTEGPREDILVKRTVTDEVSELVLVKHLYVQGKGELSGHDVLENYVRSDAGGDSNHFYHVTPTPPVEELHSKALTLQPPPEPGPFRKPDLVELAMLDPAIHLDIRYASASNFLGTPVYTQARAFMQRPAADALLRALRKLQPLGYGLLIHDAYRPWYVTKIFWDATPPEGKIFVANPQEGSKHNRGCAVDLTLYDLASGKAVEMPGMYDEMSPRSFLNFPGGTSLQRWHRDLLRRAMESEGFTVNEDEWWHFDYKDWKQYGILNVPFEKLGIGQEPTPLSH